MGLGESLADSDTVLQSDHGYALDLNTLRMDLRGGSNERLSRLEIGNTELQCSRDQWRQFEYIQDVLLRSIESCRVCT